MKRSFRSKITAVLPAGAWRLISRIEFSKTHG